VAVAAPLALAYMLVAPPSTDLAAAAYRSDLFSRVGFSLWDNSWYGGHPLPAYSILAPALGAWIGPQLLAALAMVAATALFAALIDGRFPARAVRVAAIFFAIGASVSLLSNRVPFDLGLALGLASLLATRRGSPRVVPVLLAILCSLASPVAGAFLALAFLAWALAGPTRAWPLTLVVAALAPIGLLTLAFPEGGTQPFAASAFYPALAGVVVIGALIPREQRVLRIGALLYAVALVGAYVLPTAVGGNADRLGALFAGPVAACILVGRDPRWLLGALAPFLLYWQANAPVADFLSAASDPAVHASYYTPLLEELHALDIGYGGAPARIESVPTSDHGEARFLAPDIPLARGWERQLDQERDGVFYDESTALTPARYRAWLTDEAISYVALPDAPLDYSATAEGRLLRSDELRYLREIWRSPHWRLFAVLDPTPLVDPPASMTSLATDSFTVSVPRAGDYTARVRYTPYWALSSGRGCVSEAPGGWTELRTARPGDLHVVIRFSLARVFAHGQRCR